MSEKEPTPLQLSVSTTANVNMGDHGERQTTVHEYVPAEPMADAGDVEALGTTLAGVCDGAVDEVARYVLASDWMRKHDADVAARAIEGAAEAFATGDWSEAFAVGDAEDDESAVRATEAWLHDRAAAIRGGGQ